MKRQPPPVKAAAAAAAAVAIAAEEKKKKDRLNMKERFVNECHPLFLLLFSPSLPSSLPSPFRFLVKKPPNPQVNLSSLLPPSLPPSLHLLPGLKSSE